MSDKSHFSRKRFGKPILYNFKPLFCLYKIYSADMVIMWYLFHSQICGKLTLKEFFIVSVGNNKETLLKLS